ncbi:MAG: hypothetical protein LRY35_03715 [Clostridiales bacterium]|nr:hypothetical protein [Clostridiales bacterium]
MVRNFGGLLPTNLYYKFLSMERTIGLLFLMLVIFGRGIISSILSVVRIPFDLVIWTPVHWLAQWLLQFMA